MVLKYDEGCRNVAGHCYTAGSITIKTEDQEHTPHATMQTSNDTSIIRKPSESLYLRLSPRREQSAVIFWYLNRTCRVACQESSHPPSTSIVVPVTKSFWIRNRMA